MYTEILILGSIYSLFVLGIIISFRMTGFADIAIEGTFTLGGAVTAVLLLRGFNPVFAILIAMAAGSLSGLATALIHSKVKVNKLLSGIIVLSMLYSINLVIMKGPNVPLRNIQTIFGSEGNTQTLAVTSVTLVLTFLVILRILRSNYGLLLRATGENETLVKRSGFDHYFYITTGLMIANSMIALSGAFFVQKFGAANVNMGQGLLITMLASMIIGEKILKPDSVLKYLLCGIAGTFIFQIVIALALRVNIDPVLLRLVIGVVLVLFLLSDRLNGRRRPVRKIGADFI